MIKYNEQGIFLFKLLEMKFSRKIMHMDLLNQKFTINNIYLLPKIHM
jgi:hypothetical protein